MLYVLYKRVVIFPTIFFKFTSEKLAPIFLCEIKISQSRFYYYRIGCLDEELVDGGSSQLLELSRGRFHEEGSYAVPLNVEIIGIRDFTQADELIEQLLRRVEFEMIWLVSIKTCLPVWFLVGTLGYY